MSDTRRAALPPWFRPPPPAERPGHALIVGAGVAGAATAAALVRRGWRVTVAERHERVAAGASGNPAGIHMPRVVAGNSPERDFHAGAYRYGLDELDRLGPAVSRQACGVLQISTNERQVRQRDAVLRSGFLPPGMMRPVTRAEASELAGIPVDCDGFWFPQGGWVEPGSLCRALLAGADVRTGIRITALHRENGLWHADSGLEPAEAVVLANSVDIRMFSQSAWLPLSPRRGQISVIPASERSSRLRCVVSHDGYIIPAINGEHVIGATFDHIEDAVPAPDQPADTADDARNLAHLEARFPGLLEPDRILSGRASLRAMTTDHLPLVGSVPVMERFTEDFAGLRQGRLERTFADAVCHPGLWVLAGLGARGLVTAPLAAEFLAAQISGGVWPIAAEIAAGLHPARFLARDLKRAKV
jgi:tRNA 5-methylaminomethyl-2-thiouridine biosynthesis bifunctional protein